MSSIENLKILYVEDDAFAREEMQHFLRDKVKKVFLAADGREGVESFEFRMPDIVIADILMPVMDGISMIKELKKINSNAHIVITTSVNSVDTVLEAVDLGIDGYIVKPLDFAELELKLNKIGDVIQVESGKRRGRLDALEDKSRIEDTIKKDFMKTYKEYTGKGPRETVVQLLGDEVKLTVFDALTTMEKSLLKSAKNFEIVKQMRNVVYEAIAGELSKSISACTGHNIIYEKTGINLKKGMEQMTFKIKN